jgi:flagellar motor switch protein FliG
LKAILDVLNRERSQQTDVIGIVLNSPVAKNIFLGLPEQKRYDFIRTTSSLFN